MTKFRSWLFTPHGALVYFLIGYILVGLSYCSLAQAQQVNLYCATGSAGLTLWQPASSTNPCPVTATITPSGTQNVTGTGTAGTAAAGVLSVQGIASMTPVLATLSGTNNIATVTAVTAITNALPAGTNTIGAVSTASAATGGYSFLNIPAGQATTTVKSGAGTLHSIILNSAATATNTTVIYDNTAASGTVIGRPAVTTATVPTTLIYDLAFSTGLTIITATANGGDMTVTYK